MVARRSSPTRRHSIHSSSAVVPHRLTLLASLLAAVCAPSLAAPVGGNVVAGSAQIDTVGTLTVINQNSANAVINWNGFNIGAAEIVRFLQPSSSSVALNRVVGGDASQILGRLEGNGRIFLVNPNGILFAPGSQVNVGGLFASTLNISDADLMASRLRFSGDSTAAVVNQGAIRTAEGGFAVLAAQTVRNDGVIATPAGSAALVGAHGVTLDLAGNGLLRIAVDQGALNAEVANSGSISASGGQVLLSTHAQDALLRQVVNQSGIIEADSVGSRNGVVTLDGGQSGIVAVTGTVSAAGRGPGSTGGRIDITGDKVGLFNGAVVDASGAAGGGAIRVGGGLQGKDADLHNANAVIVEGGAALLANAVASGDGGRVIVWSDQATRVHGSIDASAAASGGNGGFVETSGHWLDVEGASVRASAARGAAGTWLLDPTTVTIYDPSQPGVPQSPSEETQPGVTGSGAGAAYVWKPGSGNSYIPVAAINQQLNTGTNVTVTTDDPSNLNGSDAGDIFLNASISKTNGGDATLSLLAAGSIFVGAQGGASIASTSGKLNVVLDAFKDGATAVTPAGQVQILSGSSITTNGGFLAIGGGALGADGKPSGFAVGDQAGVVLQGVVLDTRGGAAATGGGAISIAGAKRLWTMPDVGAGNGGVEILSDFTAPAGITTGGGSLTIRGDYTGPALPDVNSPYYAQYRNFVNTGDITNLGTAAVYLDVPVNLGGGALAVTSNGGLANAGTFFGASGSTLQAGSASFNVSGAQADLVLAPRMALSGALNISMSGGGQTTQKSTIAADSLNLAAAGSDIVLPNNNQFRSVGGAARNLQLKIINPANATTMVNPLTLSGNLLLATNGAITGSGASSALGSASAISAVDALGTRYDVDFATAGTFDFTNLALVGKNTSIAALQHLQFKNLDASGSASFSVADGGFVVDYAGVADSFRVGQNLSINTHGVNGSIDVNKSITVQGNQVSLLADSNITLADGVLVRAGTAAAPATVVVNAYQAGSTAGSGALALNGSATILNHGGSVDLAGSGAGAAGIRIDATGAIGSATESAGNITLHADASGGADALVLDGALYTNGAVSFAGRRAGETMGVAGGAGTFNISRNELSHIVPGAVGAFNFGADGTITVGNAAVAQDAYTFVVPQVAFSSARGDLRFDAALSFAGAGATSATLGASAANGTVSQSASANLSADTLALQGQVVNLGNTSNQINHFNTAGVFNTLILGNSRQIVIADQITAGTASFDASGNTLSLTSTANRFGGPVNLSGGATIINGAAGLTLGAVDVDSLAATAVSGALQFGAVSTVRGNLLASATTGAISGSGALSVDGDASFVALNGGITLGNTANVLRGATSLNASGDALLRSGADLRLGSVQANNLDIQGDGAIAFANGANVGGAMAVNSLHGAVTQAGALHVAGASAISGNQGIGLADPANTFGGVLSFNAVANDVVIGATGPVRFGAGAAGGAINLDFTGAAQFTAPVVANGNVTVRALSADVAAQGGSIRTGGPGMFKALQANAGDSMGLAGGAGTFQLSAADLNAITGFSSYEFGSISGGKLTFGTSNSGVAFPAPVTLRSGAAGIRIDGPLTATGTNLLTLSANAGGAVTQSASGAVVASTLLLDGSGNFMLDGANRVGSIGSTGPAASLSLNNSGALTLGFGATPLTVAGNANLVVDGALTQALGLHVGGATTIHAGANAVTLTDSGNVLTGAVSVTAGATALRAAGPLAVQLQTGATNLVSDGDLLVSGNAASLDTRSAGATSFNAAAVGSNLHTVAGGAVSQSGALGVVGTADIDAGANSITLANGANALAGPVLLKGGTTSVANAGNLTALLATGNTELAAAGTLTVSGSAANLTTVANATDFGATSVTGNLNVRANGDVTQRAPLAVSGASSIDAGAHAITLADAANSFGGTLALTGANALVNAAGPLAAVLHTGSAALTSTDALLVSGAAGNLNTASGTTTGFGVTSVAGDLSVRAGGAVTQSGALSVTGAAAVDSGANAITLTDAGNAFAGVLTLKGGATSVTGSGALNAVLATGATDLRASGPLAVSGNSADLAVSGSVVDFGATSVTGKLSTRATGAVTQSGRLAVTGASAIDAGTIALSNAGNAFGGAVSLTGGATNVRSGGALTALLHSGATQLQSAGALSLSGTAASLQVLAGGAVTQSAALAVSGASAIDAGANAITLTDAGNQFAGAVTLSGAATAVTAAGPLTAALHTGATSLVADGALSVSGASAGLNTRSGAATDFGAVTVNGQLASLSGGAVSQSGALAVSGSTSIDAGANSITLANRANALAGIVTLKGGATTVSSDADLTVVLNSGDTTLDAGAHRLAVSGVTSGRLATNGGDTTVGATTVGASADITSSGAVAFNGALTVARDLTVRSASIGNGAGGTVASTGVGILTLAPASAATAVTVGGANGAGYAVTTDMLARFGSGFSAVTIGRDDLAGALTVAPGGAVFNASATLLSGKGGIALAGPVKVGDGASLSLLSSGAIADQAGAGISAHNLILGGGAVNLSAATHQVDSLRTSGSVASLAFVDDRALTLGADGGAGLTATGALSVQSRGALRVAAPVAGSVTRLVANANGADQGNLVFGAGGSVTATGSGDALVLATTGGELINGASATAVQAPNGRWVIYLGSPAGSTENGLAARADAAVPRIYDTAYSSAAVTQPGNHLVYRFKPTLALTADNQARVYGAADATPTYKVTGLVSDDGVTDMLAAALGSTPQLSMLTGAAAVAGVSPIAFVQKPASPIGYATSFTDASLTVSQALLTVTADSSTRLIAQPNPALTYNISGFQYGQGASVLTGPVQISTLAALDSPVGQYAITPGSAAAANYSFRYVPGLLTVFDPAAAAIGAILNQAMSDCAFLHRCDGRRDPFQAVPANLRITDPDGPVLQGSATPVAQKVVQR